MRGRLWLVVIALVMSACVASEATTATTSSLETGLPATSSTTAPARPTTTTTTTTQAPVITTTTLLSDGPTVRILLVGDVMLGRGIAPIARADPEGLFEEVRFLVSSADVAAANLESPLTTRPHIATNPYALEADPSSAVLLARAGFDVLGVANNHSGDAGRQSIMDTVAAVEDHDMQTVGAGWDVDEAFRPLVIERDGLKVGFLAFDATLAGTPATDDAPGIAHWVGERVQAAVEETAGLADVVVVGIHGGVEYYSGTDPGMEALAERLAGWGADIVWGHGPHVAQPVLVAAGIDGRTTLVATSLGNFLFDQSGPGATRGAALEVLIDRRGLVAHRLGTASHDDRRVHFEGWALPEGDAALIGMDWWSVDRAPSATEASVDMVGDFAAGTVVEAAKGDVTGDGDMEVVVSFRRPFESNDVNSQFPDHQWADAEGRSAHLGVYAEDDLREVWVAGTLFRPVADLAVCHGSLALAFDSLDYPAVVATGAWVWQDFGFATAVELPRGGRPACADIDGDGRPDPLIIERE